MLDILGNKLTIGSRIVYPVRNGAVVRMKTGIIITANCGCGEIVARTGWNICSRRSTLHVMKDDRKMVKLTALDNVVVVGK